MPLIDRIDAALERMRQDGTSHTVYYRNLLAKRDLVLMRLCTETVNVVETLIADVARNIPRINRSTTGEKIYR